VTLVIVKHSSQNKEILMNQTVEGVEGVEMTEEEFWFFYEPFGQSNLNS